MKQLWTGLALKKAGGNKRESINANAFMSERISYEALKHYGMPTKMTPMGDALCIHQANRGRKERQVMKMAKFTTRHRSVCVGPAPARYRVVSSQWTSLNRGGSTKNYFRIFLSEQNPYPEVDKSLSVARVELGLPVAWG